MTPRSSWRRLTLTAAAVVALASASARADVLHATYRVSLIGLPIGAANLNAELSPNELLYSGRRQADGSGEAVRQCAGRFGRRRRDRRRPRFAFDLRYHRRQLQYDPHHPHGASGQRGQRRGHRPAVRGQARPRSARAARRAERRRSDRRLHLPGASLRPDPVAGSVQPQDPDFRRLHPLRHRSHLCRRAQRKSQGLRGAGRGLRLSLRADFRPQPRPGRDQIHGRQQGPRSLAGADRERPHADPVPRLGPDDDRHHRDRGVGIQGG